MSNTPADEKSKWSPADMAFKVVKHGSEGHTLMTRKIEGRVPHGQPSTVLYDSLALRYNQCEPGDLFVISLPNRPTAYNLRKNLKARGVGESDYRLFRPSCDETGKPYMSSQRPLAIQRLTNKLMTTLLQFPAEAAQLAKLAEARGQHFNFAQTTNPSKPGSADDFQAGNQDLANT